MLATDSPAEAAFRDYAATGDVTGLLALADYLDERGERKAFAKLLRSVGKRRDPDVHWFYREGGANWFNVREEEQRLRCAVDLAKAEDWYEAQECERTDVRCEGTILCRWERDEEWSPDNGDYGDCEEAWVCVLYVWSQGRLLHLASLHGITFENDHGPENDLYARVVRAELCLEAMRQKRKRR